MAQRTTRMYGGTPCVIKYSVEDSILSSPELNVKIFEAPNEQWAKFVITNRNYNKVKNPNEDNNADNRYDVVFGPIANDDLALLFRQFAGGLISVETLVNEMKYKKLTNQYSFHTERAISLLEKLGVYYV